MKNKESRPASSVKSGQKSKPSIMDADQIKQKITQKNKSANRQRSKSNGPTKTQIDRMKKFYYTTKWLPNSAFTTYFGKPAFENYGYGNTKPVYGGLFYGNYMLSHNINPVDGENQPPTKQVYSSAMLKSFQRGIVRKPEPPRKIPDEIRNTPGELQEIKERNPIFQFKNEFPTRAILKPNLIKSRYFRSAKGTPNDSFDKKEEEFENFDIDEVLNPTLKKKNKTKTVNDTNIPKQYNPFKRDYEEKLKVEKKNSTNKEEMEDSGDLIEIEQNDYSETKEKNEAERKISNNNNVVISNALNVNNTVNNNQNTNNSNKVNNNYVNDNVKNNVTVKIPKEINEIPIKNEDRLKVLKEENEEKENYDKNCSVCQSAAVINTTVRQRSAKKINPCLIEPQEIRHTLICCNHQISQGLSVQELDPRNYRMKPPCLMEKIPAAGKASKMGLPLQLI